MAVKNINLKGTIKIFKGQIFQRWSENHVLSYPQELKGELKLVRMSPPPPYDPTQKSKGTFEVLLFDF